MLRLLVLAVAIVAVAFMTSCAKDKSQQTCPIMGFKPDRALFSDYKGRRVYVCCMGCIEAFNQDPERFIKFLEKEKGYHLEQAKDDGLSDVIRGYCDRHKGHAHQ